MSSQRRSIPQGLNCGLESARGCYLIRVDGHSTIPPDYVQVLLETTFGRTHARELAGKSAPAAKVLSLRPLLLRTAPAPVAATRSTTIHRGKSWSTTSRSALTSRG